MISDKISGGRGLKRLLNLLLSFVLAAVFLFIAFYDVDFGEVLEIVSHASLFWILIFVALQMVSHFLRALRWKYILNSVKPDVSLKNLFGALMVGYGVNCVVPRLGEVSRAVLLGKWEKLSRSSMFGTVILERIIDIVFLGLTMLITMIIWSENISHSFPWIESALYITLFVTIGVFIGLGLLVKYRQKVNSLLHKSTSRLSEKTRGRIQYGFNMMIEGFSSLKGTKNYISVIALSIIIIVLYALSSYIGFFTLAMQDVKPVTFAMGWVLMSISAIGVVIPTPGGTGSYHTLAKSTLVLLFGFGETISAAYAFLTHIVSYFLFIFTALIIFFVLNKQHDNLIKVVETDLEEL